MDSRHAGSGGVDATTTVPPRFGVCAGSAARSRDGEERDGERRGEGYSASHQFSAFQKEFACAVQANVPDRRPVRSDGRILRTSGITGTSLRQLCVRSVQHARLLRPSRIRSAWSRSRVTSRWQ